MGVGVQRSLRFGGRLLGILKREYDGVALVDPKKRSFEPLRLQAEPVVMTSDDVGEEGRDESTENATTEPTSSGNASVDVTAWVELMHQTKRIRQRAYIVRVRTERRDDNDNNDNNDNNENVNEQKNIMLTAYTTAPSS